MFLTLLFTITLLYFAGGCFFGLYFAVLLLFDHLQIANAVSFGYYGLFLLPYYLLISFL
jgi:hypothetical protein